MIWGVRYVAPRVLLSAGMFFIAFRVMAEKFFVAKIFSNFANVAVSNAGALPQFITSALNHASPSVLVLISACGIAGFFLAVKLFRTIRSIIAGGNLAAVLSK